MVVFRFWTLLSLVAISLAADANNFCSLETYTGGGTKVCDRHEISCKYDCSGFEHPGYPWDPNPIDSYNRVQGQLRIVEGVIPALYYGTMINHGVNIVKHFDDVRSSSQTVFTDAKLNPSQISLEGCLIVMDENANIQVYQQDRQYTGNVLTNVLHKIHELQVTLTGNINLSRLLWNPETKQLFYRTDASGTFTSVAFDTDICGALTATGSETFTNTGTMDFFDAVFYKWDSGTPGALFWVEFDGSTTYSIRAWTSGSAPYDQVATLPGKPTGIAALRERGIVVTIEGANGYLIYSADPASKNTQLDCYRLSGTTTCENTTQIKVFQGRAGVDLYRPVYAVKQSAKGDLYMITQEDMIQLSLTDTNSELNFFDYPVDVGRFHLVNTQPGECGQTTTDYSRLKALYLTLGNNAKAGETAWGVTCEQLENIDNICGNGHIESGEACDDGNMEDGDGCKGDCSAFEDGWNCNTDSWGFCTAVDDFYDSYKNYQITWATLSSGATNDCTSRYCTCTGSDIFVPEVVCYKHCGDGVLQTPPSTPAITEICEDGNTVSGDGCASDCLSVETGFWCNQVTVEACDRLCPNNIVNHSQFNTGRTNPTWEEACDDGNDVGGDGCSADCSTMETGWTCLDWQDGSPQCRATCVNGGDATENTLAWLKANVSGSSSYSDSYLATLAEQCDDGNSISGDGCSSDCRTRESPWTCPTPGQGCVHACGNTFVDSWDDLTAEECDDGNEDAFDNWDGCTGCVKYNKQTSWLGCPDDGSATIGGWCWFICATDANKKFGESPNNDGGTHAQFICGGGTYCNANCKSRDFPGYPLSASGAADKGKLFLMEGKDATTLASYFMVTWVKSNNEFRYYETHDSGTSWTAGTITKEAEAVAATGMGGSFVFTGQWNTEVSQWTWNVSDDTIYEKTKFGTGSGLFDINWPVVVYNPVEDFFMTRGLTSQAELFRWDAAVDSINQAYQTAYAGLEGDLNNAYPVFVSNNMYVYQEDVLKADGSGSRGNRIGMLKYDFPNTPSTVEFTWLGSETVTEMVSFATGFAFVNGTGILKVVNIATPGTVETAVVAGQSTGTWRILQRRPGPYEKTQDPAVFGVNSENIHKISVLTFSGTNDVAMGTNIDDNASRNYDFFNGPMDVGVERLVLMVAETCLNDSNDAHNAISLRFYKTSDLTVETCLDVTAAQAINFLYKMDFTVLLVTDTHERNDNVQKVIDLGLEYDAIFHLGDFCDIPSETVNDEREHAEDLIKGQLAILESSGKPVYYIVGNHDPKSQMRAFTPDATSLTEKSILVDLNPQEIAPGLSIVGLGGSGPATVGDRQVWGGNPWETKEACTETVLEKLQPLINGPNQFIVATHFGPERSSTSLIQEEEDLIEPGNYGLLQLLLKNSDQVLINLHGHVHPSSGSAVVNGVRVLNPGNTQQKHYALVTFRKREKWEIKSYSFHKLD